MNYEVTLRVKTNKDPEELVDVLRKLFKEDALTIDSYHWTKIEPRPTGIEHHGGETCPSKTIMPIGEKKNGRAFLD